MREYKIYYYIYRILLKILFAVFFVRYDIEGEENLIAAAAMGRGVMLASNHISNLDPVLYMLISVPVAFMAKNSLFRVPVLGWCIKKCGHLSVNRGAPDSNAIRNALSYIENGRVVAIFPEGTRSVDGELKEGKAGCGMIALKSKATVVPAAIWGSHEILPKNTFFPRMAKVKIKIGAPINFEDLYAQKDLTSEEERTVYKLITAKIMEEIRKIYETIR